MKKQLLLLLVTLLSLQACQTNQVPNYDLVITNATIYDGSGSPAIKGAVAINADTIVAVGELGQYIAKETVDAQGQAVTPGFINMLSWATESLLADGRGMSDLKQGVTLEVMGEGWSMGPLNAEMKAQEVKDQGDIKYDITWNTLGEYLQTLEDKGVSLNVACYVGATTLRIHEVGFADRKPTEEELANMKALTAQA